MSDKIEPTIGDPDASPDYLAAPTKRGKGVRRLNRVPLFIVGALVVLAVLAITYTFFQRQAAQRGVATSPIDPGNVTAPATAPIRPETSIPPAPPAPPTDAPVVPPIEGGQPAPANAPAATPPVDPELEARLRLIRRVEENRFAAHEAALGADPSVLAVWRLDRLGRSMPHLIETIGALEARGVGFRSLTEAIDTTTPGGRLIFHVFGALGQFERDLIRERTKAGLTAAAARGRKGGRKPVVTADKLQRAREHIANGLNVREAATRLKVSKTALYTALQSTSAADS